MKTLSAIIVFFLITNIICLGQSKDVSIGVGFSFQNEIEKRFHNDEKIKSFDQSFGTGVKVIKDFNSDWGLKIEVNYIKRKYVRESAYNPRYFYEEYLMYFPPLSSYGYHTIEPSLGVIRYLKRNEKWQSYINFNLQEAISFKSFYNPESGGKLFLNKLNLLSGSLTCNLGFERKLSELISINIEPFVRVLHIQRNDNVLYGTQKNLTVFDNFGFQLFLMHGL